MLKQVIIFVAGAVCGALPTYFIVKAKADAEAEDRIDEMRNYYNEKLAEIHVPPIITEEETEESEKEDSPEEYKSSKNSFEAGRGTMTKHHKVDYTACYTDPAESEHPQDDEYEDNYQGGLSTTKEMRENSSKPPKFIKAEDFGSDPAITTMTLCYYTGDGVLTIESDQDEEIVSDFQEVEDMIGNALEKYGFRDNDESVIYIRNYSRNTDYEIVKVDGSYSEMGLD